MARLNQRAMRSYIKGLVFESSIQKLVESAGFIKDPNFSQYRKGKTSHLHGRAAVHQIDISGTFALGIPFVNPIFLVGEAKNYAKKVGKDKISEFMGKISDITQYNRVNTKTSWIHRYRALLNQRVTYCPVFFSRMGFAPSAEALMFAHGINYISYEDSASMNKLGKLIDELIARVDFKRLNSTQHKYFKSINDLRDLPTNVTKKKRKGDETNYEHIADELINYVNGLHSYIAVLDNYYPIHIIATDTKDLGTEEINIIREKSNFTILQSNRLIGTFTLPKHFVENYIKQAKKKRLDVRIFKLIHVFLRKGNQTSLIQLNVSEETHRQILNFESKGGSHE